LQIIDGEAFVRGKIFPITVEGGSRHFRVWGDFLMDIEGITVVRYLGCDQNLTLALEIETLGAGCFSLCGRLSSLVFEQRSNLKRIEAGALCCCSGLTLIWISASVESLCTRCFEGCFSLSFLTFEAESKLTTIAEKVFYHCIGLKSIWISASVKIIHGLAFVHSSVSRIAVEEGNANVAFVQIS
jgi:hypothetical protein